MIELLEELDKFSHTKFYDPTHLYHINGKKAVSTTTLIGQYKKPFDSDFWSKKKADEWGMTQQEVIDKWALKRDIAAYKGSSVHEYLEFYLNNKLYAYKPPTEFGGTDPVREKYDKIIPLAKKFCEDIKGRMIPVKSEVVVGDPELMIAGMIDQIFFNKKTGKLELWDWKTNQKLETETPYKLLSPIIHLSTSELHVYSLQLSCYKYIIEKNTNLEFGDSFIVWFNEANSKYKVMKCFDFEPEIKSIIKHYQESK